MRIPDVQTRPGGALLALVLLAAAGPALAGDEEREPPRFLDEIVVTGQAETGEGDLVPREAMLAVGDLDPGDEVPAPERSVYLTLRAAF